MEEAAAMEEEVAVGKRGRGEGSKAGRRYVRGNVGMEEEEEAEEVVVGSRGGKGAVPLSRGVRASQAKWHPEDEDEEIGVGGRLGGKGVPVGRVGGSKAGRYWGYEDEEMGDGEEMYEEEGYGLGGGYDGGGGVRKMGMMAKKLPRPGYPCAMFAKQGGGMGDIVGGLRGLFGGGVRQGGGGPAAPRAAPQMLQLAQGMKLLDPRGLAGGMSDMDNSEFVPVRGSGCECGSRCSFLVLAWV